MKNKPTKHHLIPKHSESGVKGTNHPNNLIVLKLLNHREFHSFFKNDTPKEQLERLFKLNYTCLADDVKSDIIKILDHKDLEYFYKYGTYRF